MGNWRVEDPPLEPKFGQDEWDREIPTLEAFVEETGLGAAGYGIAQWTYPTRQEDLMKYAKAVSITSSYIRRLGLRSINKRGVMDMWILDIRKAWA